MKTILAPVLVVLCISCLYSQNVIVGIVQDEQSEPIMGASISQDRGDLRKIAYSDWDGAFHMILKNDGPNSILVSAPGYHAKTIDSVFQTKGTLLIQLKKNPNYVQPKYLDRQRLKNRGAGIYGIIDIVDDDFDVFTTILGKENVSTLNRMSGTFNFELAFMRKRFHYGFIGGLLFTTNQDPDSIDIELNNSVFGLNLGYRIIDHKRFFFMPTVAFKWYKYRLINSDLRDDNQLSTFVQQSRDLDIRIWQPTAFLGASLAFKFDGKVKNDQQFWTLGLYGGYLFKLRDRPHINGVRSQLDTNAKIKVHPFNLGIFCFCEF